MIDSQLDHPRMGPARGASTTLLGACPSRGHTSEESTIYIWRSVFVTRSSPSAWTTSGRSSRRFTCSFDMRFVT
jgi:hypothetical protein